MTEAFVGNEDLARRIQDSLCTVEELKSLVGISVEIDRLIASNERTSADTLEKLSRSADNSTRECVVGNPNTSLQILRNFANEFPRAFLINPSFNLILLKNPTFLESLNESTLAKILKQKECSKSMVVWAFNFYGSKSTMSWRVLRGIVKNPNTPVEIINDILCLDTSVEITCEEGLL